MESTLLCTICGVPNAKICGTCNSAAYCSPECRQTDWKPHNTLCRKYRDMAESKFVARPSPRHHLAIYLPMSSEAPKLAWVDSKTSKWVVHTNLNHLLAYPGAPKDIRTGLHVVRGNVLRSRTVNNEGVLNIWYIEALSAPGMTPNQSPHGTAPTLIGSMLGEIIFKGPIVVTMKVGSDFDAVLKDITMAGWRDAIDFLGYYWEGIGSMIDGPGLRDQAARRVMAESSKKLWGVRINCKGDQGHGRPKLERVAVPKTHSLFNFEGDNPLQIPEQLGVAWVAKSYFLKPKKRSNYLPSNLENPLARLLLLSTGLLDGKWKLAPRWEDPYIGSILVVERGGGNLEVNEVEAMCDFIKQRVLPSITDKDARKLESKDLAQDAITPENFDSFMKSRT